MLERIAAALDLDTPQLFSMATFTDEALKKFQTALQTDIETALTQAVTQTVTQALEKRIPALKTIGKTPK